MSILVTGSAGHLGEALVRVFRAAGEHVIGLDIRRSPHTDHVGSVTDRHFLGHVFRGVRSVIHTAALHKPHLVTHSQQAFIDINVSGTLSVLETAAESDIESFVFTSTTSTYGHALTPGADMPAAWITEAVTPQPKNIYGAAKLAAEHLCEMFSRQYKLPLMIVRVSRFFPEEDDRPAIRDHFTVDNAQLNELLFGDSTFTMLLRRICLR